MDGTIGPSLFWKKLSVFSSNSRTSTVSTFFSSTFTFTASPTP